jgi:hypothetical protein
MCTAVLNFGAHIMNMNRILALLLPISLACMLPPVATAQHGSTPLNKMLPIGTEKNPPGDIPDNQVFVAFKSSLGFSVKVPEGWARRELPGGVSFSDKYNELQVTMASQASAPTLSSLRKADVVALEKSLGAIRVTGVKALVLPAGQAFVVHYESNSEANPVTNKAIRLDNERYYFWKTGRLAILTLSAPVGAYNVDQWQMMAKSFAWQ